MVANNFSQSLGCLFNLFLISFFCVEAFKFNQVSFIYFNFSFHYSGSCIQKDHCDLCRCSMFSSNSFIVPSITFRSLICFEFIFVYSVRECADFILLCVAVQFSYHHLLERLFFLHCLFLSFLS